MSVVVLGGGGLLGSGFRTALARRAMPVVRVSPPWGEPHRVADALASGLPPLLEQAHTLIWAAGVGHVGAGSEAMAAETAGVEGLCAAVEALPPERRARVRVLFASSAGALFAGAGSQLVDERTPPSPTGPYGRTKLAQEQTLRELADSTGCTVVLARISNVYGLADGRVTPRGLVGTAVRAVRLRQPMTVYVDPDNRRDYVFSADAAAQALQALAVAPRGASAALVRDGTTRTVAEVLAVVGAVARRRVPAVYAERPATRLQPRVLRFAPPERSASGARRTAMEAAVHLMLRAPLSA